MEEKHRLVSYVGLLEVAHDGVDRVDRVVPGPEAGQEDAMEVKLEH